MAETAPSPNVPAELQKLSVDYGKCHLPLQGADHRLLGQHIHSKQRYCG